MKEKVIMSTLPKAWIFDLDGTLLKHNGYKLDGRDSLLPGVKEYLDTIPKEDKLIILTSRTEEYRDSTIQFLEEVNIHYDAILFNMPFGERIVVNDRKPSGLEMALAFNMDRDHFELPVIGREK